MSDASSSASIKLGEFLRSSPFSKRIEPSFLRSFKRLLQQIEEILLSGYLPDLTEDLCLELAENSLNLSSGKKIRPSVFFQEVNQVDQKITTDDKVEFLPRRDFLERLRNTTETPDSATITNGHWAWEELFGHCDRLTINYSVGVFLAQTFLHLDLEDEELTKTFLTKSRSLSELFPSADPRLLKLVGDLTEVKRNTRSRTLQDAIDFLEIKTQELEEEKGKFSDSSDAYTYLLKELKNQLVNVSSNNQLLNTSARKSCFNISRDKLNSSSFLIAPADAEEVGVLEKLVRASNKAEREKGVGVLNLVYETLIWHSGEQLYTSPVGFLKCTLRKQKGVKTIFELDIEDEQLEINPILRFVLRESLGINMPKTWAHVEEEDESLQEYFKKLFLSHEINLTSDPLEVSSQNWCLKSDCYLGAFDQPKSALLDDYDGILTAPQHPLIKKLFEGSEAGSSSEESFQIDFDIESNFTVFPSDPTQDRVIQESVEGTDLVVEGPPGTGKSQTIANVIANFLANGKKVLLVSEKRAALDVVWNRLKSADLHHLGLLVHDQKREKKELIQSLRDSQSFLHQDHAQDMEGHRMVMTQNFERSRRHLEMLVTSSASIQNAGFSYNELHFKLHKCNQAGIGSGDSNVPEHLIPWYEKVAKDEEKLSVLQQQLREGGFAGEWAQNPFAEIDPLSVSQMINPEVELSELVKSTVEMLKTFSAAFKSTSFNSESLETFGEAEKAINWCKSVRSLANSNLIQLLNVDSNAYEAFDKLKADYLRKTKTLERRQERLQNQNNELQLYQVESAQKLLAAGGRRNRKKVKLFLSDYYQLDQEPFSDDHETLLKYLFEEAKATENLAQVKERLLVKFGIKEPEEFFSEFELLNDITERTILQLPSFFKELFEKRFPDKIVLWLLSVDQSVSGLFVNLRKLNVNYRSKTSTEVLSQLESIMDLAAYKAIAEASMQFGRLDFEIKHCLVNSSISPEELVKRSIEKEIGDLSSRNPILAKLSVSELEQLHANLKTDYENWLDANKLLIVDNARQNFQKDEGLLHIPAAKLTNEEKQRKWTLKKGKRLLEHEFQKKTKFKTLRELCETEAKDYLETMVKVWLLSPESAAEILPLKSNDFDLVIFDEASQLRTEAVVPSLFRAAQTLVFGDLQQLPPSSFFKRTLVNEQLPDHIKNSYSFLELSSPIFSKTPMKWHYRSKYQELIQFNNVMMYGGELKVFPSAGAGKTPPIELHENTECAYEAGINSAESEKLVQGLKHILIEEKQSSVAVVTLSKAQQEEVERCIDALAEKDDEFAVALERASEHWEDGIYQGLIIQNLENIQGDERDVVLVSTSYGPGKDGELSQNFGPINHSGGQRRLNVVFSRARTKMHIYTSLKPELLTNELNEGASFLKYFLMYAKGVSSQNPVPSLKFLESSSTKDTQRQKVLETEVKLLNELLGSKTELKPVTGLTSAGGSAFYHLYANGKDTRKIILLEGANRDSWNDFYISEIVLGQRGYQVLSISARDLTLRADALAKHIQDSFKD